MKSKLFLLIALAVFAFQNCSEQEPSEIVIPAGSVNALAQAVAAVDEGGTVRLATGLHTEDARILIDKNIKLVGDPGSVLISNTTPIIDTNDIELRVALHVLNAPGTSIEAIEIRSSNPIGGTAILLESSNAVKVQNCKMTNHQFSIVVEMCDEIEISGNEISGALDAVFAQQIPISHGIIIVNGRGPEIRENNVSNCFFAAWLCDEGGLFEENMLSDNAIAVIGCVVPKKAVGSLPRNPIPFTEREASDWIWRNNHALNNFLCGYALADGSHHNILENNISTGNAYGIELFADSYFFGFFTKKSSNNVIKVGTETNITIKDCGEGNTRDGGILIDTSVPSDSCR